MTAILEPRAHHEALRSPAPRRTTPVLRVIEAPVPPLVTPAMMVAMVATVLVAVALSLGVSSGAFSSLVPSSGSRASAAAAAAEGGAVVVVEEGDSLWTIARELQPTGDVRALVQTLIEVNGSAPIIPGQQIVVPN